MLRFTPAWQVRGLFSCTGNSLKPPALSKTQQTTAGRMLAYGGMSKGRLRRFFPSAEVFGTFCVKKYSKNDNWKNKRQLIKGKLYWRIENTHSCYYTIPRSTLVIFACEPRTTRPTIPGGTRATLFNRSQTSVAPHKDTTSPHCRKKCQKSLIDTIF